MTHSEPSQPGLITLREEATDAASRLELGKTPELPETAVTEPRPPSPPGSSLQGQNSRPIRPPSRWDVYEAVYANRHHETNTTRLAERFWHRQHGRESAAAARGGGDFIATRPPTVEAELPWEYSGRQDAPAKEQAQGATSLFVLEVTLYPARTMIPKFVPTPRAWPMAREKWALSPLV